MDIREKISPKTVTWIGIAFAVLNIGFIVTEQYWGLLLPLLIGLGAALILSLDKVLLFLVFTTPLSLFYFNKEMHLGFTLPTEPILVALLLLFILKVLHRGSFDPKFVKHPLTIAFLVNLGWMIVTSVTSEMPLVSFKLTAARLWFLVGFYFLMSQILRKSFKSKKLFFWMYLIPLSAVIIYTVIHHGMYGFTKHASGWVMTPFYKEHTSYGAVLALYFPVAFMMAFVFKHGLNNRTLGFIVFGILTVGIILSYTRAAWLSVIIALGVLLLILVKPRKEVFLLLVAAFLGGLLYMQSDISRMFENTTAESSDDLGEHVSSMSNVTSDASNLERINRWKSALRMFAARPVFGFGPGTYMFLYAPFQKPYEKTIISTNAGDMGNAHSEYIGPLSESGVIGGLSVIAIVVITITTGLSAYYNTPEREYKMLALAALLGLVTYWSHGFLNNFIDIDKAACPVFGFSALLVVLDLRQKNLSKGKLKH